MLVASDSCSLVKFFLFPVGLAIFFDFLLTPLILFFNVPASDQDEIMKSVRGQFLLEILAEDTGVIGSGSEQLTPSE